MDLRQLVWKKRRFCCHWWKSICLLLKWTLPCKISNCIVHENFITKHHLTICKITAFRKNHSREHTAFRAKNRIPEHAPDSRYFTLGKYLFKKFSFWGQKFVRKNSWLGTLTCACPLPPLCYISPTSSILPPLGIV